MINKDNDIQSKTFRKYKQVKHGQTTLLTSNNALKARHQFLPRKFAFFII